MADRVRLVDYFYVMAPDRPGEGARMLNHLKGAGVSLLALHAFPQGRRAQVDFVPANAAAFRAAARAAKWSVKGPRTAFHIEGADRTGALVGYATKLGRAKINVTAVSASTAGAGRYGAILWVKQRDVKRAAKLLGAR
jgi:hypothetical protein